MVVFDNLANILGNLVNVQESFGGVCKEWKILGEESSNRILVGCVVESTETNLIKTCIAIYSPALNSVRKVHCLNERINIIQATVNKQESIVSFVGRDDSDQSTYTHFLAPINETGMAEAHAVPGLVRKQQIMTTFIDSTKHDRLLIMTHTEAIRLYHLSVDSSRKIVISKEDSITGSFCWAQWDLFMNCLYFIHFRKSTGYEEEEEKQQFAPTLTAFQFHPDLPHETVLNIPLNLPSLSKTEDSAAGLYEDDCVPLRVHDCSLDLLVITERSGMVCICHHYLYQPVKPPTVENNTPIEDKMTVYFAYSVTLLHHGCVIHCAMPGVPWAAAKTLRPGFALLGSQYLLIHGPGVLTHLLDIGLLHEPNCHIVFPAELDSVPNNGGGARLVALNASFSETSWSKSGSLAPTVMLDLNTLDLLEVEVTTQDLLDSFRLIDNVSNRLAILHYFLVHLSDLNIVEEILNMIASTPHDINATEFLQEILVGGTYSIALRNLPSDAANLLSFLPITCLHPSAKTEIKVNDKSASLTQEILWNTAMMLLSPQQRLVPYKWDVWTKLWEKLSRFSECPRFKPSQVSDKLSVSLACYQPEALSRCTTPMSPAAGFVPDFSGMAQFTAPRKSAPYQLPFHETDSSTANKQEHIISVNLRELNMYLMKNCSREAPMHVHAVATRYVTAQLDMSKQLCHLIVAAAGLSHKPDKGFSFIRQLEEGEGQLLVTLLVRYFHACQLLAFPLPLGFSSFFCYLGYTFLPFNLFLQYLNSHVFQLQVDVVKEILMETDDSKENVAVKLRLVLDMPRLRGKRLLNSWSHPVSLMMRAREHALNVLSGVQSARPKTHLFARRAIHASRGLAAFPSADRVSPLDTFLDLLTAKASLAELDFNLLIEATVLSTEEFL